MHPFLFIVSLVAAGVFIVAFSHVAVLLNSGIKWSRQRRIDQRDSQVAGYGEEWEPGEDEDSGTSPDFAALIHAIHTQGRANRNEERREDYGKRFRELLTIVLLSATLLAISWQVYEMTRVYGPIKDQAVAAAKSADAAAEQATNAERSMIQAARAWAGPSDASLEGDAKVGESVQGSVKYQNTGREPAIQFTITTPDLVVTTNEDDRSGIAGTRITADVGNCRATLPSANGQVVYPTSGSTYNLAFTFPKEMIDQDVVDGKKLLAIQGCFIYVTTGRVHRSMWCYFYKAGQTKKDHLNICTSGNYAD